MSLRPVTKIAVAGVVLASVVVVGPPGLVAPATAGPASAAPAAVVAAPPRPAAAVRACTIVGTNRDDVLRGTPRADVICGLRGDDVLIAVGAGDVLRGGPGDDDLRGGRGDDLAQGGTGDDKIRGDRGDDRLLGQDGDDLVLGNMGDDLIVGGAGDDVMRGYFGADVLRARDGDLSRDRVWCGPGPDRAAGDTDDRIRDDCETVSQNHRPTGVALDPSSVAENEPAGTLVGTLSATDVDPGDSAGFALVPGAGSADNTRFVVSGVTLETAEVLDFEADDELDIRVRATDESGTSVERALVVTVTDVGENPPVAVDDTVATPEDTRLDLPLSGAGSPAANDTDPDGDPLVVTGVSGATGGTVAVVAGEIRFEPTPDLCGAGAGGFGYTVSDGTGRSDDGAVTVDITCVDDQPVAVDDTATLAEDAAPTAIDVRANDTDADGDTFTIASVSDPDHGTVVLTGPAGARTGLTYEPDADYCNTAGTTPDDTFTYTLAPGAGTATVSVVVTCGPDAPLAVDDAATVTEDAAATSIDVLANDTDADGDVVTIASVTVPDHGTAVLTGPAGARTGLTYEPDNDYCNTAGAAPDDAFTYTLDGGGTATVSVVVTCVDDAPVAVDDEATVTVGDPATPVDVLANDTDVDGGPISVATASDPAHGTVVVTGGGSALTYEPDPGYCNTDGSEPDDTFSYTLAPGDDTATVSVEVTCDVPPVAVDDTATVAEDSGANAIDVLANDTNPDGGPLSVASAGQPAHGTVTLTGPAGASTGLAYAPDADYCNTPIPPFDTFTYTVNGGDTATVSVAVTCVDDGPVAVDDTATVLEDSGASPVSVLANDTDVDGGPRTVASVTQPANGTVVITGGGTGLSYAPNANYCNTPPPFDTFTYTLAPGGSSATVRVAVTCVDDAPGAVDDAATVVEDAAATAIDVRANDTDPDAGTSSIGSVTQPANGTVVVTGGGTALTYAPNADYCNTPPPFDTFTYTLAPGGSAATVRVTVTCVDDVPVAVDDTATVAEDSGASTVPVLANDTDVDGGPRSVASVTQPGNGTAVVTGGGTGLSYAPGANYCNTPPPFDTFTYTLAPGGSTATVRVTVTCVDDAPTAVDDTATVVEDSGASAITVLANDTDVDAGPRSIGSVTQPANGTVVVTGGGTGLSYAPGANYCTTPPPFDTFTYTLTPGGSTATVRVTVTCVDDAPTAVNDTVTVGEDSGASAIAVLTNDTDVDAGPHSIASVTQPANGTVVVTGGGTGLTYAPGANYCNTSPPFDTFTYTLAPGSSTATVRVGVTCVNDAPDAVGDTGTTDEDTPLTVAAPGVLANDTDIDAGDTRTVVELNGTGTLAQTLPSGASVTINADGSYTYNPSAAFQGLSTGQSASDSFTYTAQDAGGAQDTATVTLTITGISDAPTAVADSFDAIGNTGLYVGTTRPATQAGRVVTGSVLSNDTDPDTPQAGLVVEPVTNAPTALGGTITVGSDGSFTYHPDDADTGVTDTFTYRVCDASPCTAATVANATGTLSLPIAGQVWYVRNIDPAGGDGTSDTPFDTLAEAEAASGAGDTVYVFDGANTTTNLDTGYAMDNAERLVGESRPLTLDPDAGGPLGTSALFPGTPGSQPTLTATNEDVVVLASNVLVDGIDVDPRGTGGGFSGTAGTADVTVQNVNVTDTGTAGTQPGVELDGTTGVNRFTGVTVTNGGSATAIGARINNADRVLFAGTNTIATTGAKALDAASTSLLTSRWNDITVTGSGTGAIRLSSTTGQPVLGDGAGTDLSLQTTSGATAALEIASSNTVTVDAAGTDTISATGGPAMDVRNSNGSQLFLDSASSTTSAGDGINLDTNLTTPVVIDAGTIAGAAGIAFDLNGGGAGGGGVVFGGVVNDGPGQSVEVTGRDGGGATFSGSITDSGDAGGGIVVSGSSAGSTTFSGTSKTLSTGASTAVSLSSNGSAGPSGHAVSFLGGGLDIDTTSGSGLVATNGGQLVVGGAGNTITTGAGAGTGLLVDGTSLAPGDVTFQSISTTGAVSGVRLNNTGTGGRLVVTGTGGTCTVATPTCTGGTITGSSGDAVSLSTTASPTFSNVNVRTAAGNGLVASGVSALSIANSLFVDNSDDTTTNNEANLRLNNLTGASSVTGSVFRQARVNEVYWTPVSGTATMTWTGNTVGPDAAGELGSGLLLNPTGTAAVTLTVSGGSFGGVNGDSLRVAAAGGSTTTATVTGATTFADSNSGVNLSVDGDADLTYDVRGSTFLRHASHALQLIVNETTTASSVVRGRANNNTIGNGTPDSGSRDANGISYDLEGAADIVLDVTGNSVRNTDTQGIFIQSVRFPSGTTSTGPTVDLTLRDNTVSNIDDNSAFPFGFQHGTQVEARRSSSMCLDVAGNSSAGVGGAEHVRVRQRDTSTFRLERLTGSGSDDANVAAFIAAQNDAGTSASVSHATTFTAVADGACRSLP